MKTYKRPRWHSEHKLDKVKAELKRKMKAAMADAGIMVELPSSKIKKLYGEVISVHVLRDCDLRATLEEKALSCHRFTAWTAFVNKAGTLIHLVPNAGDFHIRHPLYFSTKAMSDKGIERMVQQIAMGRLR